MPRRWPTVKRMIPSWVPSTRPSTWTIASEEPARIFYTLDGAAPTLGYTLLIVRDRSGATTDQVLPDLQARTFAAYLAPVVAKDAVLVSDGRDAYGAFAHAENILHIPIITSRGEHADREQRAQKNEPRRERPQFEAPGHAGGSRGSSRTCGRRARRCSHRTPARSTIPTHSRSSTP